MKMQLISIRRCGLSFLLLLCISLLFQACKNADDSKVSGDSEVDIGELTPQTGGNHGQWTFLTNGLLINRATVTVGKDPAENPNKGYWYDLKPDGTFEFGMYDQMLYNGYWNYDHESQLIEILPAGQTNSKSEWRVMHNNDIIVFVGTSTHGNNNTQMQFIRSDQRPVKEG